MVRLWGDFGGPTSWRDLENAAARLEYTSASACGARAAHNAGSTTMLPKHSLVPHFNHYTVCAGAKNSDKAARCSSTDRLVLRLTMPFDHFGIVGEHGRAFTDRVQQGQPPGDVLQSSQPKLWACSDPVPPHKSPTQKILRECLIDRRRVNQLVHDTVCFYAVRNSSY